MGSATPPETLHIAENARPRGLWRNRDFLLLWSGQTVSVVGTHISLVALPLLVLALEHSPAQAGIIAAIQMVPYLLFSLPVGALVDRWDRKAVMIRCDAVRWLAMGSVPLAFFLGWLTIPQLYMVAFIEGTANVLFGLSQISALPRVVPASQVPRAYALSEITEYAGSLLGPNLSTLIISLARSTVIGAMLSYLLDSISYLASVISLAFIRTPFQSERREQAAALKLSLRQEIAQGLRFLWEQRLLRIMALLGMAINFLLMPVLLAVIVLVQDHLHLDVLMLGLIIGASGIGGLLGGFIAPWIKEHFRFGLVIISSVIGWIVALALITTATSALPLIVGRGLLGLIWPIYAVTLVSYRLSLAPDELQGRVNSSFRFLTYGSESLGALVGGLLLVPLGPRLELGLIGAGLVLCVIVVSFTQLRRA